MMTRRVMILVLVLLPISISSYLFYQGSNNANTHHFSLVTAKKGSVQQSAYATGYILPKNSINIKSQIDGIVGEIFVSEGDHVNIGDPLLKITPTPTPEALTRMTIALKKSRVQLQLNTKRLENYQKLIEQKIIPSNYSQYIKAQSDLTISQAEVEKAEQELSLLKNGETELGDNNRLTSTLYAPIEGMVLNIKIENGGPVTSTASSQSATAIMTIANMKRLIFKGMADERDVIQLKVGMSAALKVSAYPQMTLKGVLSKIAIQSNTLNYPLKQAEQRTFKNGFEIEIDGFSYPDDFTLKSGLSTHATITLKIAKDVVLIPEHTLRFEGDTSYVLVPNDMSTNGVERRLVTVGLSDGVNIEILSGLEPGNQIVDRSYPEGKGTTWQ
ncbi:efflux RND transporter periplasmic adaptor subunit [Vibrio profundi]|uniref:efflux RND transporter periplasmic adaptor subunit n=1 Tax=Vibrio profundi TaxID=1774960 RepID=UPI003735F7BE